MQVVYNFLCVVDPHGFLQLQRPIGQNFALVRDPVKFGAGNLTHFFPGLTPDLDIDPF